MEDCDAVVSMLQDDDSQRLLEKVKEAGDCRELLHGRRRSAYVGPPKFDLSIDETLDDINKMIDEATVAVSYHRYYCRSMLFVT